MATGAAAAARGLGAAAAAAAAASMARNLAAQAAACHVSARETRNQRVLTPKRAPAMSRAEPGAGGAACVGPCSAWNLAAAARERRCVRARQCGAARTCQRLRSLRRLKRRRSWRRRRRGRRRRRRLRRGRRSGRRRRRRRRRRLNRRRFFRCVAFAVDLSGRRDGLADAARFHGGGPHRRGRHGRRRRFGLRRGGSCWCWRRRAALAERHAVLVLQQAGHRGVELAAALRARQASLVPLAWRRNGAAAASEQRAEWDACEPTRRTAQRLHTVCGVDRLAALGALRHGGRDVLNAAWCTGAGVEVRRERTTRAGLHARRRSAAHAARIVHRCCQALETTRGCCKELVLNKASARMSAACAPQHLNSAVPASKARA